MSLKYLGDTLDIHGGGQDLVFPHHENEIAQSESFTGKKPFVKYWLHNGLVQLGEDKMSKSLGNLVTIKQALGEGKIKREYNADILRIFILNSHYRSPLTYSEEGLKAAEGGMERLVRAVSREDPAGGEEPLNAKLYEEKFKEAMDDDFNTAQALAVLFDLANAINQAGDAGFGIGEAQSTLVSLAREVLGLRLRHIITTYAPNVIIGANPTPELEERVNRLVEERVKCRREKNWQRADEIRKKLAEFGIDLEDTPQETKRVWRRAPSVEALDSLMEEMGIEL
jgi:cysteinyl-tRNA synthetase